MLRMAAWVARAAPHGGHDYSPWILAVPLVSYPLSGIVVTWVTRLLAVFSWLLAKSIEYYLKIFRLNWF